MMPNVVAVEQTGPYRLRLRFNDGAEGELDMKEYLPFDGVFEPLKDPEYFAKVRVDDELGTIVWPNGADLDPEVLHSQVTGIPIVFGDDEVTEDPLKERSLDLCTSGGDASEISRFYGIVVSMDVNDAAMPHFHAHDGRSEVVVQIRSLGVLRGGLPPRAMGLLMEWAATHQNELLEDWGRALSSEPLKSIPPLE